MFDLFGAGMPLAVRFFLAFLVVLGLIGATAWAVRRFGSARLGGALRGRQPRLAVIDYANVDARRRLILVRRDNVEHLVMIGGPTDVVVESNIVRAVPAARDVPVVRPVAAETLPRAVPLPEAGGNGSGGSWPLQPDTAGPPPRRARVEPIPEEPHVEIPPRIPREPLAALGEEQAAPALLRTRTGAPARQHALEPRPSAPAAKAETASAADQNLAEMAQRLEAALRKPKTTEPREAPAPEHAAEAEAAPTASSAAQPRPARPPEAKPARTDGRPKEGKALHDTLEQEMASLLGRPAGKT